MMRQVILAVWQWAASTGTDSVPYFRIFNPTLQSKNLIQMDYSLKICARTKEWTTK